jgi:hypothetical protein
MIVGDTKNNRWGESGPGVADERRCVVSLQLGVHPVHSLLHVLILFLFLLLLGVLLSAAAGCARGLLQFPVALVAVVLVVGVGLVAAASDFAGESGVAADDALGGGEGLGVGLAVAVGALAGGAAGVGAVLLAGVSVGDDLVVALADAALDVRLLARVEQVEGAEAHNGDHRHQDGDVERG